MSPNPTVTVTAPNGTAVTCKVSEVIATIAAMEQARSAAA